MFSLILADNQDITRYGVKLLATLHPTVGNVAEVATRETLVETLLRKSPAVVVVDYTLFNLHSVEELLTLEERFKEVQWILFSEELSEEFLCRALLLSTRIGAVMKDDRLAEIAEALDSALKGKRYVSPRIAQLLQGEHSTEDHIERERLTTTEKEILKLIAVGKTTREIAAERFLSVHTVMTHRKNIFRKLQVNNAHEATKYAIRSGLISGAEYYI